MYYSRANKPAQTRKRNSILIQANHMCFIRPNYWKTTGGMVTQLTTFCTPPLSHENKYNKSTTKLSLQFLRATAYKYEEYGDRSKISDFILFHLKDPFGEPFSKITLKLSIALSFLGKIEKLKKRVDGRLTPLKNNVKSCNLKRFVRSND